MVLFFELHRARNTLCLADDLHMCFLLAPLPLGDEARASERSSDVGGIEASSGHMKKAFEEAFLPLPANPSYIDWTVFARKFAYLNARQKDLCSRMGVSEGYVVNRSMGLRSSRKTAKYDPPESEGEPVNLLERLASTNEKVAATLKECTAARLYTSFMLRELVSEKNEESVADQYNVDRGFLQQLSGKASSYAAQVCAAHSLCTLMILLQEI